MCKFVSTASTVTDQSPARQNTNNTWRPVPDAIISPASEQTEQYQTWQRNYPWCLVPDAVWYAIGLCLMVFLAVPALSLIALTTVVDQCILLPLCSHIPVVQSCADAVGALIRRMSVRSARTILVDVRNAPFLPWIFYTTLVVPIFFLCAAWRYNTVGHIELSTFLLYHFLRLGPKYRAFAHHHTLIHKESHTHTGLFVPLTGRKNNTFLRNWNQFMVSVLYGAVPMNYPNAHMKIHHRWHNDVDDCSSNVDLDRSIRSEFLLFLPRFALYWTGITPLIMFIMRKEYAFAKSILCGMCYHVACILFVANILADCHFAIWFVLYPLAEGGTFLGAISYLWHAFMNPEDSGCQYVNSVTMIDGTDNIWNEDYHVVHHHAPQVHWTDVPAHFEKTKDKYREHKATIFANCEQGQLLCWMLVTHDWDAMARHFVDLNTDSPMSHEEKKALLLVRMRFREKASRPWSESEQRNWDGGKKEN